MTDSSNPPLPLAPGGPQNMALIFRIYSSSTGGSPLWSETQTVTVNKGRYTVLLGNGTATANEPHAAHLGSLFVGGTASDRYLAVTIAGSTAGEFIPRLRLLPSAFALVAEGANAIGNANGESVLSGIAGGVVTSGTVTAGELLGDGSALVGLPATGVRGSLSTAQIPDSGVAGDKIAPNSITASLLSESAITTEKLADNALGSNVLTPQVAATSKLLDGSVDADRLAPGTVAASLAAAGKDGLLGVVISPNSNDTDLTGQGYVRLGTTEIAGDYWTTKATEAAPNVLSGRRDYLPNPPMRSVWTGSKWLVWGGMVEGGATHNHGDGAMFDPALNTWTRMAATGAPSTRREMVVVWTGTEAIYHGGYNGGTFRNGAKFNPVSNTWTAIAEEPRTPRTRHTGVWTGSHMIIFGGLVDGPSWRRHGSAYNPVTDTWTAISDVGAPAARSDHVCVWTGTDMLIYGGRDDSYLATGARYNPANDTWTPMLAAPRAKAHAAYAWTGNELIVWGGFGGDWNVANASLRYNPISNTWIEGSSGSFRGRWTLPFVWTGQELVVFGGANDVTNYNDDGARWNPATDQWKSIPRFPLGDHDQFVAWTGKEMLITQGALRGQQSVFAYIPPTLAYIYSKP